MIENANPKLPDWDDYTARCTAEAAMARMTALDEELEAEHPGWMTGVLGATVITDEHNQALHKALMASSDVIQMPVTRDAILLTVERNWNAGPDLLTDAIIALIVKSEKHDGR